MVVSTPASDKIDLIQHATVEPLTELQGGRRPSSSNLAFAPTRNCPETDIYCLNASTGNAKETGCNYIRCQKYPNTSRFRTILAWVQMTERPLAGISVHKYPNASFSAMLPYGTTCLHNYFLKYTKYKTIKG
ncbi:hypothetical protein OUZ56_003319 [Daphnia magna]|uniref:Uncharacterized protein n=1 Tax=Daphnia magna TaxID=35525 RepID=A0ABR0A8D2_9CRUS|nr:hypothetical protein OUZ56_003319 [Daphnia magna]